jgi:hypothetical protein
MVSSRSYASVRAFDSTGAALSIDPFQLMAWHGALQMPDVTGDESDNDEEAPGARFNEPTSTVDNEEEG